MHKDNFVVDIATSKAFSTTLILKNKQYKHNKRSRSYLSYNQIFVCKMSFRVMRWYCKLYNNNKLVVRIIGLVGFKLNLTLQLSCLKQMS